MIIGAHSIPPTFHDIKNFARSSSLAIAQVDRQRLVEGFPPNDCIGGGSVGRAHNSRNKVSTLLHRTLYYMYL